MENGIIVLRSSDDLKAFLMVYSNRKTNYPGSEELLMELKKTGIVYGIDDNAITMMVRENIIGRKIEVAQGKPPEPGIPGRIEMLVDVSVIGKPKKLPDGRVDFHDICYVLNVRKGQPLARKIHAVPGVDGQSVGGWPIRPPLPKEAILRAGPGTAVNPADPDVLTAQTDGAVWVEHDGTIEVRKEKKIPGDIDYRTGNVNFAGDLTVTGSVRAGFSVESKGTMFIGGSVEDSRIKCHANLVITGGAVGKGTGSIECAGAMKVRHLENFNVTTGGLLTVTEDIVNSTIVSGKSVHAKSIRGGLVAGTTGVEAETIGSDGEVKTVIDIGKKYEQIRLGYALLSKLASLTTDIGTHRDKAFRFVKDSLDENGTLSYDDETMLGAMKQKMAELMRTRAAVEADIEKLDSQQVEDGDPYVLAARIFPNTVVKFGAGEQVLREPLQLVRLVPVARGATVTLTHENAG